MHLLIAFEAIMTEVSIQENSSASGQTDPHSIFETDWRIYRTLVDYNLFCHREIASILSKEITDRFPDGFKFLDLACGDAEVISRALRPLNVHRYHGVDLSPQALDLAWKNLVAAPFDARLEEKDIRRVLLENPQEFDVVWCGLSLHHFASWDEKAEVLTAIYRALNPGGVLLTFEPVLPDGVTLDAFNRNNRQYFRQQWSPPLSGADFMRMMDHIETCDFPETKTGWQRAGLEAGFQSAEILFAMPGKGYCQLFRFEK